MDIFLIYLIPISYGGVITKGSRSDLEFSPLRNSSSASSSDNLPWNHTPLTRMHSKKYEVQFWQKTNDITCSGGKHHPEEINTPLLSYHVLFSTLWNIALICYICIIRGRGGGHSIAFGNPNANPCCWNMLLLL